MLANQRFAVEILKFRLSIVVIISIGGELMSIRKFLNAITVIPFLAFEGSMFYLIHFGERSPDFDPYYASIIAAAAFALLIFLIRLITARAENRRLRDEFFNAKNGNFILVAMIFTLVADYYLVAIPDYMELRG